MKIAIVDDRWDYLDNLEQALMEINSEVIRVDASELGLEKTVPTIHEATPDFVMLDHDMGSFTGKDVADRLDFSPEKLVGTSDKKQPYCGRSLPQSMDKSYASTMVGEKFQKLFQ